MSYNSTICLNTSCQPKSYPRVTITKPCGRELGSKFWQSESAEERGRSNYLQEGFKRHSKHEGKNWTLEFVDECGESATKSIITENIHARAKDIVFPLYPPASPESRQIYLFTLIPPKTYKNQIFLPSQLTRRNLL